MRGISATRHVNYPPEHDAFHAYLYYDEADMPWWAWQCGCGAAGSLHEDMTAAMDDALAHFKAKAS